MKFIYRWALLGIIVLTVAPALASTAQISGKDLMISQLDKTNLLASPANILSLTTSTTQDKSSAAAPSSTRLAIALETEQEVAKIVPRGVQHFLHTNHESNDNQTDPVAGGASLAVAIRLNFI